MTPRIKSAVALLSSGLDSSVALMLAQSQGIQVHLALTFDYGQRSAKREGEQSAALARHFGVPHRIVSLPWFRDFRTGGALLSDSHRLPQLTGNELGDRKFTEESARAVWVPNRNGVFIEIAAAFAEDLGADSVVVGFNSEEAETFPDNSVPYMNALTRALSFSTANHVRVLSPTGGLNKTEIVHTAVEHQFPFELLWSCYDSGEKMCGRCESCARLKRALQGNEVAYDVYFQKSDLEKTAPL